MPRSRFVARLSMALAVGLVAGAATEWSVPHLPFALEPLGNTAAPWVIVAFVVAVTVRRIGEALVVAIVTLVALVLGFYVAEAYRGWPVSRHQVVFWSIASVVAGPLVGLAAGSLRHGGWKAGALGGGVLGGVLVGESIYGLADLRFSSPARYWHVQFVVGVALAAGLGVWRSRHHLIRGASAVAASLVVCSVVGLVTFAAYRVM